MRRIARVTRIAFVTVLFGTALAGILQQDPTPAADPPKDPPELTNLLKAAKVARDRTDEILGRAGAVADPLGKLFSAAESCAKMELPDGREPVEKFGQALTTTKTAAAKLKEILDGLESELTANDPQKKSLAYVIAELKDKTSQVATTQLNIDRFNKELPGLKARVQTQHDSLIAVKADALKAVQNALAGIKRVADVYCSAAKAASLEKSAADSPKDSPKPTARQLGRRWQSLTNDYDKLVRAEGFFRPDAKASWPKNDGRAKAFVEALGFNDTSDDVMVQAKSDAAAEAMVSAAADVGSLLPDRGIAKIKSETDWIDELKLAASILARHAAEGNIGPRDAMQDHSVLEFASLHALRMAVSARAWGRRATEFRGEDRVLDNALDSLTEASAHLAVAVADVADALAGDQEHWVTEHVRLYYFLDVKRLMTVLNQSTAMADPAGRQTSDFAAKRLALRQAQLSFRAVYDELTQLVNKLVLLRPKLEAAKQDLKQKKTALDQAGREERAAKRKKDEIDSKVTTLENEVRELKRKEGEEQDERKRAQITAQREAKEKELGAAKETQIELTEAHLEAEAKKNEANAEHEKAKARVSENEADKDSLPNQIAATQSKLLEESRNLKAARDTVAIAAENALEEFALERDNRPFLRAKASRFSTDPLRRCALYGFEDTKTILVRGMKSDVEYARDVIAQFDRPSPMARLTLWTLQMNLQQSRQIRHSLGGALERVDKELSNAREATALVSSVLRDELNRVLRDLEEDGFERKKVNLVLRSDRRFALDAHRIARSLVYNDEVAWQLGLATSNRLKWHHEGGPPAMRLPDHYYFTRWTLPDPAATTTLGETLMILALTKRKYQCQVLSSTEAVLRGVLKRRGVRLDSSAVLRRLNAALGFPETRPPCNQNRCECDDDEEGLTAYQKEILQALKRAALERFIAAFPDIKKLFVSVYSNSSIRSKVGSKLQPRPSTRQSPRSGRSRGASTFLTQTPDTLMSVEQQKRELERLIDVQLGAVFAQGQEGPEKWAAMESEIRELKKALPSQAGQIDTVYFFLPAMGWLYREFGISSSVLIGDEYKVEAKTALTDQRRSQLVESMRKAYPRDAANARIAAADEMLKAIMMAVEDDVDRLVVQPTLAKVRRMLLDSGVDVGLMERTSVLSTNRSVARVDPAASAQLDLGGEQRLLEATGQLAQIVGAFEAKRSLPEMLDLFKGMNQEPPSELYALLSGSQFKVTPIFDPTGQALRFQFDYIKTTNIADPDGSVNPQLPRIERHAVNTTVQLSNLEIREISRFEVNAKLGVPRKQWGGIPILKDLPLLQDLPLIGWFTRRNGKAAVSQASLILGQTSMYPTIEDIGSLLTGSLGIPPFGTDGGAGTSKEPEKDGKGSK